MEPTYQFSILYEEAVEKDLFPDSTHEAVAKNLYEIIENNKKGVTIGLEGGWGSGKSTVIAMLRKKLSSPSKETTLFFIFDAWAHEGDPLRRIFLQSLINEADPNSEDPDFQDLREEISLRKKIVSVQTKRRTSKFAALLSLSALLVPPGAALLSAVNYTSEFYTKSIFWIGTAFSLTPLLTTAAWAAYSKCKTGKIKWSFIDEKSDEEYSQDITENQERSSIEFEDYFKEIAKVIEKKGIEKTIIVVDNLDRVDQTHAHNIWSTLQTFFQYRSSPNHTALKTLSNVWFIIPYDREGLENIWSDSPDSDSSIKRTTTSKSFLEKSIQLRVEVPPPVISGWISYLEECIKTALSSWPLDERKIISETYQRQLSSLASSPTPRQIRNFVNQVGLLGTRWRPQMTSRSVALYAILRLELSESDLREKLLKPNELNIEWVEDFDQTRMELTGIFFGVESERGAQILLSPEIKKYIFNQDKEGINHLIEMHKDAFWVCWHTLNIMPTKDSSYGDIVPFSIIFVECWRHASHRLTMEASALQEAWTKNEQKWNFSELSYSGILQDLYQIFPEPDTFLHTAKRNTNTALQEIIKGIEEISSAQELIEIEKCQIWLSDKGHPPKKLHYPKLTAQNWIKWHSLLEENGAHMSNVLPDKNSLDDLFNLAFKTDSKPEDIDIKALEHALSVGSDAFSWVESFAVISDWAQHLPPTLTHKSIDFFTLLALAFPADFSATISKALDQDTFISKITQSLDDEELTAKSSLFLGVILKDQIQSDSRLPEKAKEFWKNADAVNALDLIEPYKYDDKFWHSIWILSRDTNNKLASALITDADNEKPYLDPEPLLNISSYRWLEPAHIKQLCAKGALEKAKKTIRSDIPAHSETLFKIYESGTAEAKAFSETLALSLDKEAWVKCLEGSDTNYMPDLAIAMEKSLDHVFTDAFYSCIYAQISEDSGLSWIWKNLDKLIQKTLDQKINKKKLISKYFQLESDNLRDESFDALKNQMAPYLSYISGDLIYERVIFWFSNEQWARILWLLEHKESLQLAEPPETLTSMILRHLSNTSESRESAVVDLASFLKVSTGKDNQSESEKDEELKKPPQKERPRPRKPGFKE